MISFSKQNGEFALFFNKVKILQHSKENPCVVLGKASASIDMYRGNYFIDDTMMEELALTQYTLQEAYQGGMVVTNLTFSSGEYSFRCEVSEQHGRLVVRFSELPYPYNRLMLRFYAQEDEQVWGCGEQFSYFGLRGKKYPLWTQEQGVGRNKNTEITQIADKLDRAGGDYHTTFYPQPTFVSSRSFFLHAQTDGYAVFDFCNTDYHQLLFWDVPSTITISVQESLLAVVQDISSYLGRQPVLPDWVYDGIILGIQGGTATVLQKLRRMQSFGMPVNGLWIQDWEGERYTSFGKRLRWNWQWDAKLYPNLDQVIKNLREEGVKVLGYINPYVLKDEALFKEAQSFDLLAKNDRGEPYFVDFGEFDAAVVDFTNPKACLWYQEVIKREMIDLGLAGWMADFGEYLPTDVLLHNKRSALLEHNPWPGYWAKVNHDAIKACQKENEILYFMRAGSSLSLAYCPMMWAGDQNVDWSEDDGLASALCSALSLAMSGMGLHHSDIGGYTTLYGMKRSKELLLRWTEFAAFTPLMRTHEGNRPKDNWQFDSDEETIEVIANLTKLHVKLKRYLQAAVAENAELGIPVMRPLFLHYQEPQFFTVKDSYLLGRDLLIAPVLEQGATQRKVLLPDDDWVHLCTKKPYGGGSYTIEAPIGSPVVFYRQNSEFADLFASLFSS